MTVTLSDNHFPTPLTSVHTFTLKITDSSGLLKKQPTSNATSVVTSSLAVSPSLFVKRMAKEQKKNGTAYIKSIDHFGRVTVAFNQPISILPDNTTALKDRVIKLRIQPGRSD